MSKDKLTAATDANTSQLTESNDTGNDFLFNNAFNLTRHPISFKNEALPVKTIDKVKKEVRFYYSRTKYP